MDRRKSLKLIATGALAGTGLAGCNTEDKKTGATDAKDPVFTYDRSPDDLKNEKRLLAMDKFFTAHEIATIAILADIIIPADEVSGSATDAKVPDFIEFIVKDMPNHQVPMRGGLRWLDMHCFNRFQKSFKDCSGSQQLEVVEDIAYPVIKIKEGNTERTVGKIKPGMEQGVAFFSLMRNLTATGFFTSEIGVKDIGYIGNRVNKWNGVPDDVLAQYQMSYDAKQLKECISFDKT
jgi:gluconate 2-dehydrogenase gamma chain